MSTLTQRSEQEQQWLTQLQAALTDHHFQRLVLSQYQGEIAELEKVSFRIIEIQQQPKLCAVYQYKTQDVTKNYDFTEAYNCISELLADCKQANLFVEGEELQLKRTKKKVILTRSQKQNTTMTQQAHNREKQRYILQEQAYLQDLGITDHKAQLVPSMARKWKQINKFIEIFSNAIEQITPEDRALHVVDFGSGKGYLTFAMYDYLQQHGLQPKITGVELRDNLVEFCQKVADKNQFSQLEFFQGDVRSYQPEHLDVMIALHACDIATDFAIHCGIRLNASVIMCAPCCHKELRPQLKSPEVLKPMLHYGIHQAQQAEMLTDTIRALLLEAYGYETKVFEFVSLEHTSKNKMILAVRRQQVTEPDSKIMAQIEALKQMYGIGQHSLQRLLENESVDQDRVGCRC
ncbi:class I SAM-dependent methyltransferase [Acinetobacter sp. ANC 4641]|uniref:class I SAM-dependent methyltransferase n=1 Tax=Acinetobacter sp. ANC 4641 TaxID=2529847 RepID=UPI00103C884C|nr:SAM-dependent methyltransferase [Acinetobacter sp. ANC 4641]TCB10430.1 SAM-dependent methyltransferase [Acinetobacter sp. ANC 4641]